MSSQYREKDETCPVSTGRGGGGVVEGQSGVLHNQRVRGREKE